MSWNSSTMIARKRSCSASLTVSSPARRSRASSWRSSKSRADSRSLPAEYSAAKQVEQLLEQVLVTCRGQLERGPLDGSASLLEACCSVAARPQRRQVDQGLGKPRAGRGPPWPRATWLSVAPRSSSRQRAASCRSRRRPARSPGASSSRRADVRRSAGSRRRRSASCGAVAPVGREQRSRSRSPPLQKAARARSKASPRSTAAVLVVELVEARVDPDRERVGAQKTAAEAVDGRDPGAVELARQVGPLALGERRADARAQLAGRLAGVGDHEDGSTSSPSSQTRERSARRGPTSCPSPPRGDKDLAAGLDSGSALLARSRSLHPAHRPEVAPGRAVAALRVVSDAPGPDPPGRLEPAALWRSRPGTRTQPPAR